MSKKIKPNRYRPDGGVTGEAEFPDSGHTIDFCLKCIMVVACMSILSLAAIFIYDFFTQSSFFNIRQIDVTGLNQVKKEELLLLADLQDNTNIFAVNLTTIEQRIKSHPWIDSVGAKRKFKGVLVLDIVEQKPLAIVRIENLTDILINTQGTPFKEYNPHKDQVDDLPVITGLDLTRRSNQYLFDGRAFDSIMNLLESHSGKKLVQINGDDHTGIAVKMAADSAPTLDGDRSVVAVRLGFDDFERKFKKARQLSEYIDKNFPDRKITDIDIYDLHKVFIKTTQDVTLHTNFERGV